MEDSEEEIGDTPEAWLSLAASVFDMAIYPTLFVVYLTRMFPWFAEGHRGVMVGLAVVVVCSLLNIAGVKVVSASGLSQYFTVNTAVGYLSASDKRLIVGLDRDSLAKLVEIRWPSGVVQKFENVKAREVLVANEPRPRSVSEKQEHAPSRPASPAKNSHNLKSLRA